MSFVWLWTMMTLFLSLQCNKFWIFFVFVILVLVTFWNFPGAFRRVAAASIQCIRLPCSTGCYDIKELNEQFLLLGNTQPTLTLQWCNVLILLNYSEQTFWSLVVQTPSKYVMAGTGRWVELNFDFWLRYCHSNEMEALSIQNLLPLLFKMEKKSRNLCKS